MHILGANKYPYQFLSQIIDHHIKMYILGVNIYPPGSLKMKSFEILKSDNFLKTELFRPKSDLYAESRHGSFRMELGHTLRKFLSNTKHHYT